MKKADSTAATPRETTRKRQPRKPGPSTLIYIYIYPTHPDLRSSGAPAVSKVLSPSLYTNPLEGRGCTYFRSRRPLVTSMCRWKAASATRRFRWRFVCDPGGHPTSHFGARGPNMARGRASRVTDKETSNETDSCALAVVPVSSRPSEVCDHRPRGNQSKLGLEMTGDVVDGFLC